MMNLPIRWKNTDLLEDYVQLLQPAKHMMMDVRFMMLYEQLKLNYV